MGKRYCLILNEFKKNYRGPNCLNSALNDADFARCTSTNHGFSLVTHFASKKTANFFKPTKYARHSMKAREGHRSCLRQVYHVLFCFPPTFKIIERANYRVRFLLTASFPTDVSDRNPRSNIFVEPSGDNDARIFGEQIGHAAPLFGLAV